MCTATWWRPDQASGTYRFLFNRDESKLRGVAEPPGEQVTASGTRFLAPTDSDRGGTWILVNEQGLTLGILNHYAASTGTLPSDPRSRGDIPLLLADCTSTGEVETEMGQLDCGNFRPFFLLALSPDDGPQLHEWDGDELRTRKSLSPPFTTSSFRSQQVILSRIDLFKEMVPPESGEKALEEFHQSMHAEDGALGVRMRRPDAQTVSFSRITVKDEVIRFDYRPDPPDSVHLLEELTLTLGRK